MSEAKPKGEWQALCEHVVTCRNRSNKTCEQTFIFTLFLFWFVFVFVGWGANYLKKKEQTNIYMTFYVAMAI